MTYDDILERIHKGYYNPTMDYPKCRKLPPDRDSTLERAKAKEEHQVEMRKYREHCAKFEQQFRSDLLDAIARHTHLNPEGCALLYEHAWDDGHSNGYSEVVNCALDLGDLVCDLLRCVKEQK